MLRFPSRAGFGLWSASGSGRLLLTFCLGTLCQASAAAGLADYVRSLQNAKPGSRCEAGPAINVPIELIDEIFPEVIHKTPGRDRGSEQLFRPIKTVAEPLARLGSACMGGDAISCEKFRGWTEQLAQADALRFDRDKHYAVPVSFVAGTLSGNLTLRPIAINIAALAQQGVITYRNPSLVTDWLQRRAAEYEHYPKRLSPEWAQNMVLNSVLAELAAEGAKGPAKAGSNAPDLQARKKVEAIFRLYLDTARVDGSFPAETRRGRSALKYSNMAVGGLVVAAEMARVLGLDLYSYRSQQGVDIHRAVQFLLSAMADETVLVDYAKENVAPTDKDDKPGQARAYMRDQLGWMSLYVKRFPDHPNSIELGKVLATAPHHKGGYFDEIVGAFIACEG